MARDSVARRLVHPLLRARDWQERPQLGQLCEWWRGGGIGVCALVGIGGSGKTAIVDRFLQVLPGGVAGAAGLSQHQDLDSIQRLLVFSFYDAPNPDEFFAELAAWLAERPGNIPDMRVPYQRVLRILENAPPSLIVLDGLEKVQDDGGRGGVLGHLLDSRLSDLVRRLASGWLPNLAAVITTRFPIAELDEASYEGQAMHYHSIPVEQISEDAGVQLLRQRGVQGPNTELARVVRECGFHALTVDLAGGWLAEFAHGNPNVPLNLGNVAEIDEVIKNERNPKRRALLKQEKRFAKIALRYREKLSTSDPAALALLERLCLFRLGAGAEILSSIFIGENKERIAGTELAKLNKKQLNEKLQKLAGMRLIEEKALFSILGNKAESIFTIHPAVRDGFIHGLDQRTASDSHQAILSNLRVFLGNRPGRGPRNRDSLDFIEEIIHHTVEGGRPQEAWNFFQRETDGFAHLGWNLGEFERGSRICKEVERGAQEYEPANVGLLIAASHECALFEASCGRLNEAIRRLESDIAMCRAKPDSWGEGRHIAYARDLGIFLLRTGKIRAALEWLQGANDSLWWITLAFQADCYALTGKIEAAIKGFKAARKALSPEARKRYGGLYGLAGLSHASFLVRLGNFDQASEMASNDLQKWSAKYERDASYWKLLLSEVRLHQEELPKARELLDEARAWALSNDAKELLCWAALTRCRLALKEFEKAHSVSNHLPQVTGTQGSAPPGDKADSMAEALRSVEEGLRISRDCGYAIYHIDLVLERARLYLFCGEPDLALADVRVGVDEGVTPAASSGLPTLLPAAHSECGYAWGIANGHYLRAQAILLQAGQIQNRTDFVPARFKDLPQEVRSLVEFAREELQKCRAVRQRIRDPKLGETEQAIEHLAGGALTEYPLMKIQSTTAPQKNQKRNQIMPQQFNPNRLKQVEELLAIEYDKHHEFDKDIALATGNEKIMLKQRVKREIAPRLRELEREYSELLVAGVPSNEMPDTEANELVMELSEATDETLQTQREQIPEQMLKALQDIKAKLSEDKESASAKLKFSLPLIPTICSYDVEVETVKSIREVWTKTRDFFKRLIRKGK